MITIGNDLMVITRHTYIPEEDIIELRKAIIGVLREGMLREGEMTEAAKKSACHLLLLLEDILEE